VAVDGFVWLHEFVAQGAREVLIHKNIAPVVDAFAWRCKRWIQQGINLIIVFDGLKPPIKGGTTASRYQRRMKNLAMIEGLLEGDEDGIEIDDALLKTAAAVTPEVVHETILGLRRAGIPYLIALTEVDAML